MAQCEKNKGAPVFDLSFTVRVRSPADPGRARQSPVDEAEDTQDIASACWEINDSHRVAVGHATHRVKQEEPSTAGQLGRTRYAESSRPVTNDANRLTRKA